MTWQFLAGGGALGMAGVIAALVFRIKQLAEQRRADAQQNRADRATENYEAAKLELQQQRLICVDERERLEAVVAAHGGTIHDLRRKLDAVSKSDPGLAADRLLGVLGGSQRPEAGDPSPAAAPEVRPATAPVVGPGAGSPRRRR